MTRKLRIKSMLCALVFSQCALTLVAQNSKRFYIANDDHTDYMWTADEAKYDSAFVHMLDYYLKEIKLTAANPFDYQTRFNLDGSFWIKRYEKYRSKTQFDELIQAIRTGHISSPLNSLVSTYGGQPTEAVLRGMYDAGKIERRFNLRFPLAVCMENQTLPLGLSSLWAGSGAKYSWRGVCGCATRFTDNSLAHRKYQLYRYSGLDSSGVIMKWYNRTIFNGRTLGGYAECRREKKPTDHVGELLAVLDDLDKLTRTQSPESNYPYQVAGAFGYGWDDLETYNAPAFADAAKKFTNSNVNVKVSNEVDFFEDIEKTYPNLPVEAVSYGNEWDTYCVSMNEVTARVRRAIEKLRSAEAMASLISLKAPDLLKPLEKDRDQAWEAIGLYWEHDWTADGPVSQKARAEWQIKLQKQISKYADELYEVARGGLSSMVDHGQGNRFFVFNPLNWVRDDYADLPFEKRELVHVVDLSTGKQVPSQPVVINGKRYLRVLAAAIPSAGYKVFEIRPGKSDFFAPPAKLVNGVIVTDFYKIKLTRSGVITSIYDKASKREIVRRTNGRYLNDLGGGSELNLGQALTIENAGPVSVTFKAVSAAPLKKVVRLTILAKSKRIAIEDSLHQNFKDVKTWSFSFNLNHPTTRHEELGAVLTAKKDINGGNYASQNARYDWLTFNHFADLDDNGYGVTLSNVDCSFFGLGASTPDTFDESSAQINALAGGQTDPYSTTPKGWKDTVRMGIYNQFNQREFSYKFALETRPSGFNATKAMKFSLEHQNPLVAGYAEGRQVNSGNMFSILSLSDPNVLVWALKPSEDGPAKDLIVRFWNMAPKSSDAGLSTFQPVKSLHQTSHLETGTLPANSGRIKVGANQITTYKLSF